MVNRLKEIRTLRGLTLAELSKHTGLGVSTINNFENGRTDVSEKFIRKVTETLKISSADLFTPPVNPLPEAPRRAPVAAGTVAETNARVLAATASWRQVPVVSWARAGAAHDYSDLCNQLEDSVETDCRDNSSFALIIEGESMEPEFFAGDYVVFSPNSEPRNGDYVVCRLREGHGVLFKKFRRTGHEGQTVRLESLNPVYKPLEFPVSAFRFIYPAVGMKRKLRR